jgi:hypothetical protein
VKISWWVFVGVVPPAIGAGAAIQSGNYACAIWAIMTAFWVFSYHQAKAEK